MKQWCYKWLPIIFGCHCRKDRSFFWKGQPFPICARCTGELIGMLSGLLGWFFFRPATAAMIVIMIPMVLDGIIQLVTSYESTNLKRVITGFFFGYGLISLFFISSVAAYRFGYHLLQ